MFSNGEEYRAFLAQECGGCALYRPDAPLGNGCPVEEAIGLTYMTGNPGDFPYQWLDENKAMARYACRKKQRKSVRLALIQGGGHA